VQRLPDLGREDVVRLSPGRPSHEALLELLAAMALERGQSLVGDRNRAQAGRRFRCLLRDVVSSEVIVGDALHDLGLPYSYEAELTYPGEHPRRPDFKFQRQGWVPVYWEHLGMLDLAGYRADWEARKAWYASHDILPWTSGGGQTARFR
jgi:hypothetical protein